MSQRKPGDPLVEDLERRIDELDGLDESAFGSFTLLDWIICIGGALVLPCLMVIWFAP